MEWISVEDRLPPGSTKVLAWCSGSQHHSGVDWYRAGYAWMVRWDGEHEHTVADGWSRETYDAALRNIGADCMTVTHWMPLPAPPETEGE